LGEEEEFRGERRRRRTPITTKRRRRMRRKRRRRIKYEKKWSGRKEIPYTYRYVCGVQKKRKSKRERKVLNQK
jgi:hypothetical protein